MEIKKEYEEVLDAIRDYYEYEWEEVDEESFDNLSEIGLAFTTGNYDEGIQVSANIPEMRIDRYVDEEPDTTWQFDNYAQMAKFIYSVYFDNLCFDDCYEEYEASKQRMGDERYEALLGKGEIVRY